MGAFIGSGVEIFMQTVVQGNKVENINWLHVGIAAVSGAVAAIPGIGWIGASVLQGVTEAALTAVDGGSLEDVLKAFTVGFVSGLVINGAGKALSKIKFCFVAGTAVAMATGVTKAIEYIRPGDMVKSYNEATGKITNKRVLQTFENMTSELVTVTTSDNQQITATPGHKFYANNNWISATDLRAGDILVNVNGQKVIVEQVQHELLENAVKVYNFEVSDNHTYFVGDDNGIAVHNAGCKQTGAYEFKVKMGDGTEAMYIGKGSLKRMQQSISAKTKKFTAELVEGSKKFIACKTDDLAFKLEAELMEKYAGKGVKLLNQIASPGFKKMGKKMTEQLKSLLLKEWYR